MRSSLVPLSSVVGALFHHLTKYSRLTNPQPKQLRGVAHKRNKGKAGYFAHKRNKGKAGYDESRKDGSYCARYRTSTPNIRERGPALPLWLPRRR
jgi:hypothetical protein